MLVPRTNLVPSLQDLYDYLNSVGEFRSSTVTVGSAVALTTNVVANMTSLVLTAGEWDCNAQTNFNATGATITSVSMGPSPTSAVIATQAANGIIGADALVVSPLGTTTSTGVYTLGNIDVRIVVPANTTATIYATAVATFSAGTVSVYGTLRARRVG
jgi:hypothetical protein